MRDLVREPDYADWRARNHVFEEMAIYNSSRPPLRAARLDPVNALRCE